MSILQINIKLDRLNSVYLDNETITGSAEFQIAHQKVKIQSLKLYMYGYGQYQTLDDSKNSGPMIKLSKVEEENYLSCFLNIITREKYGDEIYLEPGDYSYPFEIKLPGALPSSMKCPLIDVQYRLRLVFEMPWPSPDKTFVKELTVIRLLTSDSSQFGLQPFTGLALKTFNFWCCKTLPLVTKVQLEKTIYAIGDVIPFKVEVDNQSSRFIKKIIVELVRVVKFNYKTKGSVERKSMLKVEHNQIIEPSSVYTWENGSIGPIPFTQPNSTLIHSRRFHLEYNIAATFVTSTPLAVNLTNPVLITVTLPIRTGKETEFNLQALPERPFN